MSSSLYEFEFGDATGDRGDMRVVTGMVGIYLGCDTRRSTECEEGEQNITR